MTKKNILVLGGTGFIGIHLIECLLKEGYNVSALIHERDLEISHKNLTLYKGDVCNERSLSNVFNSINIVINLIGQITSPREYYNLNTIGILNILNKCSENEVEKIVFTSSTKVYGSVTKKCTEKTMPKPVDKEGIMKLVAENLHSYYTNKLNIPIICLRLSNLYGPKQKKGVIFNFVKGILNHDTATINGNGEQKRSFTYISDAISAIIKAIDYDTTGFEIFNISADKAISINKTLEIVEKNIGRKAKIRYMPLLNPEENVNTFDNSKANIKLKYKPKVTFEEGINITCKAIRQK